MVTPLNHNHESVPPLENEDFIIDVEQQEDECSASGAEVVESKVEALRGEDSTLCHFLASIARSDNYYPIDIKSWHDISKEKKTEMLDIVKNASKRNKKAREKKLMNQRTGKKSFARVKAKMTKELGQCPSRVQLFKTCFVSSNGSTSDAVSSKIVCGKIEHLEAMLATKERACASQADTRPNVIVPEPPSVNATTTHIDQVVSQRTYALSTDLRG
ncbi:hypothetical protein SASPL_137959 [Salvia splendens]|uniref:Uncharacterized protein n=1 Tax=Salvia splendens TaxID=180675 RepID=A0A8X8ZEJ0_SALSN|nr:hypothetical protein SASPL_137959 [Salvia splendens]